MDIATKLEILADAAKYDVACTSSGINRKASQGAWGATTAAGICHSFSADGRCITLLKVLMTNVCVYDCAYCVNRKTNETRRALFTPQELADLTIGFYRRNYIEGLFLSSGVVRSPDYTTELMVKALSSLRYDYGFRGYIHAKAVPGTSPELLDQLGHLADRLSVNMELPSQQSLALLAPDKSKHNILSPMKQIKHSIAEDKDTRALMRKNITYYAQAPVVRKQRAFAPAGQSTQMIIGATPESDYHILMLTASLYKTLSLKRVFYSAYLPVSPDPRLPSGSVQLNREHRLYQADWLLRFYKFEAHELIDEEHPFLDLDVDPKANWALNHLDFFPVEINTAPLEDLLRVPGIGARGARLIIRARRTHTLREPELRKLGIAYKRARFFITCKGAYQGFDVEFSREALHAQLAAPIQGGRHGRRSARVAPGQMSLFEEHELNALSQASPSRTSLESPSGAPLAASPLRSTTETSNSTSVEAVSAASTCMSSSRVSSLASSSAALSDTLSGVGSLGALSGGVSSGVSRVVASDMWGVAMREVSA